MQQKAEKIILVKKGNGKLRPKFSGICCVKGKTECECVGMGSWATRVVKEWHFVI
jgi:hypothetical protein